MSRSLTPRPAIAAGILAAMVLIPHPAAHAQDKQQKIQMGLQHETSWDLYQFLMREAGGGQRLEPRRGFQVR